MDSESDRLLLEEQLREQATRVITELVDRATTEQLVEALAAPTDAGGVARLMNCLAPFEETPEPA